MEFAVKRMKKLDSQGKLRAFADVLIDGTILIKGCRVVEGNNGLFVSMPQQKGKDDKWYGIVQCLDDNVFREMCQTVLSAYDGGAKTQQDDFPPNEDEF